MKVWSVLGGTEGSLNDWRVEGVFSSEEKARQAAADADDGAYAVEVFVHELDKPGGDLAVSAREIYERAVQR